MGLLLFLTPDRKDQQGTCPRTRPATDVTRHAATSALGEMLVCAQVFARVLRNARSRLGDDGARASPSPPLTRVIRITTRSRSVFWRRDTTTTSRSNHKRQLLSHRTITSACRSELCAVGGRNTQAGKAGVALSASLSGGVTHTGRCVFWSDHAENIGPSPLGLAPHSLNSSCVLLFFVPKRGCLRFGGLSSGSGETQNIHLLLNHP